MHTNLYEESASLYDIGNELPPVAADIEFYLSTIAPTESVLEVGCGTGRVALPLAERGNTVAGIDLSPSMLREFLSKIADHPAASHRLSLSQMDMRAFDLGRTFDWIIFPFRVFQALTTDEDRRLCLTSVRRHMHEGSRAVLTLFNPDKTILDGWGRRDILAFEMTDERTGRTIRSFQDQLWHDERRQVIAVTTRYEVHDGDAQVETLVDDFEIGYLYPDQCGPLFAACGLSIVDAFGDYDRRPLRAGEQIEQIYILDLGPHDSARRRPAAADRRDSPGQR
jgi:SAM-dependent methyltransferase